MNRDAFIVVGAGGACGADTSMATARAGIHTRPHIATAYAESRIVRVVTRSPEQEVFVGPLALASYRRAGA